MSGKTAKRKRREYKSKPLAVMPDPVEFELDGSVYTCRELGALELSEIARLQGLPATDPRSIGFMAELFESLLGAEQYRVFKDNAGKFETNPEVFVEIIEGIFEDMTNRPTVPQSDFSDGRLTEDPNLTDALSSRVIDRLSGRPDLQMAVMLAQEAKS